MLRAEHATGYVEQPTIVMKSYGKVALRFLAISKKIK